MRPLFLTPEVCADIERVVLYASAHPLDLTTFTERLVEARPVGDEEGFCCQIPIGFKAVFCIEEQPQRGWCRHLSVSVDTRGRVPSIEAVSMIALAFGINPGRPAFENKDCHYYMETLAPGHQAVNVIAPLTQLQENKA